MPRPYPAPPGRTSRRLDWAHLPPLIRHEVERRLGAPVVDATSCTSGFTPGFASVLTTADGGRHFVKAASQVAQRPFAEAYREEARKLRGLPTEVAAPALRWVHDADDWVVLGIEFIDGVAPARPWAHEDVVACLEMLASTAQLLTPCPPTLKLGTFADEFATWPALWERLDGDPEFPQAAEAAQLAARFTEVCDGESVVHTDVRDDNLLLTGDTVYLIDWNWPVLGAAWIDSLLLLIGPRGDGVDVEALVANHPTFADVPAEAIDIMLALVVGYFITSADLPVPSTSPFIREHQRWQGEVCWEWLAQRRGWPGPV